MAHMIAKNQAGESLMASIDKEWHFFETNHPVLRKGTVDSPLSEDEWNDWAVKSGLNRQYGMTPAFINIGTEDEPTYAQVPDLFHCHDDEFKVHGTFTSQFRVFQPIELIKMGREFVELDSRFHLESAMTMKGGSLLACSFAFENDISIMGEQHKLHLLLSTAMDGSRSTTFQGVDIRTVCNNTFQMAQRGAATFKLGHRSEWNETTKKQAKAALEGILANTAKFKAMAESLALIRMSKDEAIKFLQASIFTPKLEDSETATGEVVKVWSKPGTQEARRMDEIVSDYEATLKEGTPSDTAWAVFNTVTRYADHTMGVKQRGGKSISMAKDESRLFGAGEMFKSKNISALLKQLEYDPSSVVVDQADVEAMLQAA